MAVIRFGLLLSLSAATALQAHAEPFVYPFDPCPDLIEFRTGPDAGDDCIDIHGYPGVWIDEYEYQIERSRSLMPPISMELTHCQTDAEVLLRRIKVCAGYAQFMQFSSEGPSCDLD